MHILRHILFLIAFGYMGLHLHANAPEVIEDTSQARIDSLEQVIEENALEDSLLMDALRLLGWELRGKNTTEALRYSKEALRYAEQIDCAECQGTILANIGHIYWRMGNFSKAFDRLFRSRDIAEKIDDDFAFARTLNHLGILYSGQGNFDQAIDYYFKALSKFERMDSLEYQSMVLNNLGTLFFRQGDYDEAEEFHLRSFEIAELLGDERGVAYSLNNLGMIFQEREEFSKALSYYDRALAIREELGEIREIASSLRNIGYLQFKKGEHNKAIEKLSQAKELYKQVEDERNKARVLSHLGEVHAGLRNLELAKEYFQRSLPIFDNLNLPSPMANTYYHLSKLMAELQDFESAYDFQRNYLELRDSIQDEESRRRVIEIQMMYDRERKASEIDLLQKSNEIAELNLEKQRQFLIFLIIFIILILGFSLAIYYRFRKAKRTNRILQSQKEEIINSNNQLKEVNNRLIEEKRKVDCLNEKLQKSEKHLIEVNKTKDKFFSIISHDLRNPFASIVSFSRILKRDIQNLSKDELQELALELDKSVLKINSLLENLLQWSRTQTGKIQYNPEYFEITSVISENVNLFSGTAREKDIEILNKVENCKVYGDVNMTNTIVRNILSNAIKYSNPGTEVEISSEESRGMLTIHIKDQGVGISEEDQERLFRIDSLFSTYGTYDEKGSGLGLLLCKEFSRKQGGDIFLKSRPGEGSVFSFTVPLEPPADA